MYPFILPEGADNRERRRRRARRRTLHRRRHHAGRPDARDRRAARDGGRHRRPAAARSHRHRARRAAHRCAGDDGRDRRRPRRAHPLPGRLPGAGTERLGAAAEHGDHRRQHHAAHPLRLLPGRVCRSATSASPARAAPHATESTAPTRSSAPRPTASPPTLPTLAVAFAALEARCTCWARTGERAVAFRGLPAAARRHSRARAGAAAGRTDHGGGDPCPAAAACGPAT